MVTAADFSAFPNVTLVEGDRDRSILYSPGGVADADLAPVFAELGREGSGYDWQGAVCALVLERDETLTERFAFGSEAGLFCAYGPDLAALHEVAAVLEELLDDADLLRRALMSAAAQDLLD